MEVAWVTRREGTSVKATEYTPDKQAADTAPYLMKSVPGRPLPIILIHPTQQTCGLLHPHTLHIPGRFHPTLFTPPACFRVPVHCAHEYTQLAQTLVYGYKL